MTERYQRQPSNFDTVSEARDVLLPLQLGVAPLAVLSLVFLGKLRTQLQRSSTGAA